jgi:phage N-6-adenine-methyltransferase
MKESNNEHFQGWRTPRRIFDQIALAYGPFQIDAFADEDNALCAKFFTEEQDGIMQPWAAKNVWANPPYKARFMDEVIQKALTEVHTAKRCERVVILCQASVSTKWFHTALREAHMELFEGRIQFERASHQKGLQKDNSRISNALVIVDRSKKRGVSGTRCAKTGFLLESFNKA